MQTLLLTWTVENTFATAVSIVYWNKKTKCVYFCHFLCISLLSSCQAVTECSQKLTRGCSDRHCFHRSISAVLRAIGNAAIKARGGHVAVLLLVNTLSVVAPHKRLRTLSTSTYCRILVSIIAAVVRAIAERVGKDTDVRVRTDDHVEDTSNWRARVASLVGVVSAVVVAVAEIVFSHASLGRRTTTEARPARTSRGHRAREDGDKNEQKKHHHSGSSAGHDDMSL